MCCMSRQRYVEHDFASKGILVTNMLGEGSKTGLRSVGPGLVAQETVVCDSCKGTGSIFKEKDRCKKCKGNKVTEERKVLEIYIPRGSRCVQISRFHRLPLGLY